MGYADVKKQTDSAVRDIERGLDKIESEVTSMLEDAQKSIKALTTSQGKYVEASSKSLLSLESQTEALKQAKKEMKAYQSSLKKNNATLSSEQENLLKGIRRELTKTIKSSNDILVSNSKTLENALKNQTVISQRMQEGLKANLVSSESLWKRYNKSKLNSSKKHYVDLLENEQRSMSDRLSWMEDYYETYHDKLTKSELEFFDTEYKMYKQRAEDLEELIKTAGTEIDTSVSQHINNIIDSVKNIAIVETVREALSSGVDSYIENMHQLLPRTGANFNFEGYRDFVNQSARNNLAISRNEFSEVYSDFIKETRMQGEKELEYFAEDMAAQFKVYGMQAGSLSRIMWADRNSGMQNQSYRKISNIAAALEDNSDLYVDATKLLNSIDSHIDDIAYLQYEDSDTYEKMYKSLSVIEALNETSAVKGTDQLLSEMANMVALGGNEYDLRDNALAKSFLQFTSVKDYAELSEVLKDQDRMGAMLQEFQANFQDKDDAYLYSLLKSGNNNLPFSDVSAFRGFLNDKTLTEKFQTTVDTINAGMAAEGSLTNDKTQDAASLGQKASNFMSNLIAPISDKIAELDINFLNLATRLYVAKESWNALRDTKDLIKNFFTKGKGVKFFSKLTGSKFFSVITSSTFGKGVASFFTTGIKSLTKVVASGFSSVIQSFGGLSGLMADLPSVFSALGGAFGFTGLIAGSVMGAKYFSDKSKDQFREEYRGRELESGNDEAPSTDKGSYTADEIIASYDGALARGEIVGGMEIGDSKTLGLLYQAGWVNIEDVNSDGVIDEINWVGTVYDSSTMAIGERSNGQFGVYDAFTGNFINPKTGERYDEKNSAGGYVTYDPNEGSYANGLSNVPNDGFAYLHQGEAVLTKDQAITARADGGIPQSEHISVDDFEEDTTNSFYSVITLLKGIRDSLEESLFLDSKYYDEYDKENKKYINSASSGGGGFFSTITNTAKKVASTASDFASGMVNKAKAFLLGEGNSTVDRTNETNSSLFSVDDIKLQDLKSWSVPNVEDLNAWINEKVAAAEKKSGRTSVFRDNAQAFLNVAAKTGLDPRYLIAHAGLESAWGTDKKALDTNNFFGYGAFDTNVKNMYSEEYTAETLEAGLENIATKIANGYYNKGQQSLYQMRWNGGTHQYATDPYWDTKIAEIMATAPKNDLFRTIYDEPIPESTGIDYLDMALSQLGYKEGANNSNKFSDYFGASNSAWCAAFVSWALAESGLGDALSSTSVNGLLEQAVKSGAFHFKSDGYVPQAGDIFINKEQGASHTGFIVDVGDEGFTTVEGNASDSVKSNTRRFDSSVLTGYISMAELSSLLGIDPSGVTNISPETTALNPYSSTEIIDENNVDTTTVSDVESYDDTEMLDAVRQLASTFNAKIDALIGVIAKNGTAATKVPFNSDLSYVYSRG